MNNNSDPNTEFKKIYFWFLLKSFVKALFLAAGVFIPSTQAYQVVSTETFRLK